jgi:hypothetical protein
MNMKASSNRNCPEIFVSQNQSFLTISTLEGVEKPQFFVRYENKSNDTIAQGKCPGAISAIPCANVEVLGSSCFSD